MGTSTRSQWARPLMLLATLGACDPEPQTDDVDVALRDARAVAHGSGTLDGTPRLAAFGSLFAAPPALPVADLDAVRRDTVVAVHARLAATFAAIGCDAAVDTDGQTRVSMTLAGCRLLLWSIDAELEAVARVETEACDAGTCAVAVVWDADITEMSTGLIGRPRSRFLGPAELRAPVDLAEPMEWRTHPGFVIETPMGLRYDTLSTASWRLDADDCVERVLGARLSLEEREDELDERIGDLVVSARELRRCPGRCPESGRVELSFGAGQVLAWTHDGSGTVRVRGPRGHELEARLPCAEEQDDG
jgi:hypothetical protein